MELNSAKIRIEIKNKFISAVFIHDLFYHRHICFRQFFLLTLFIFNKLFIFFCCRVSNCKKSSFCVCLTQNDFLISNFIILFVFKVSTLFWRWLLFLDITQKLLQGMQKIIFSSFFFLLFYFTQFSSHQQKNIFHNFFFF